MAQFQAAPPVPGRPRLGELLMREGLLSAEQLQRGLQEQEAYGGRLGRHLVELGFITDAVLLETLGRQLKIPRVDLDAPGAVQPDIARSVRADVAEQMGFCPIAHDPKRNVLTIAVSDPDPQLLNDIEGFVAMRVDPRIAPADAIDRAIQRVFHGDGQVQVKRLQGLQLSRAETRQPSAPNMSEALGPPAGAPMGAGHPSQLPPQIPAMQGMPPAAAPLGYEAQLAQQVAMQQQLQHQQQLQLQHQYQQMQRMQLAQAQAQAQAAQAYAQQPALAPQPAIAPMQPQGGYPQTGSYPAAPQAYPGYFAPEQRPPPPAPPAAVATTPPSARVAPALPTPEAPSLDDLADQLNRLEKTLAAQARALRSLVDVLVDRGLLSKAEMARKQQEYGK